MLIKEEVVLVAKEMNVSCIAASTQQSMFSAVPLAASSRERGEAVMLSLL